MVLPTLSIFNLERDSFDSLWFQGVIIIVLAEDGWEEVWITTVMQQTNTKLKQLYRLSVVAAIRFIPMFSKEAQFLSFGNNIRALKLRLVWKSVRMW